MKKLFMIAAIAALGLGAYSCQNGPGDDRGIVGDGVKSGVSLSVTLPDGAGATRAADWGPIAAQGFENTINTVDVFLYDANGVAAGTGHHTVIPFDIDGADATFTRVGATNEYTMNDEILATAGTNMRVWVGINLPDGNGEIGNAATTFDTEDDMLLEFEEVVAMSAADDFVMFSNVKISTIDPIPVGETFDEQGAGFNNIDVDVFRAVSKIVATDDTDVTDLTQNWDDAGTANDAPLTLVYDIKHWWVFQWATQSWIAPRYAVDGDWDNSDLPRPWTYPVGEPTAITEYDDDADLENMLSIGASDLNDAGLSALTGAYSKYIGENARFGGSEATNNTTTQVFISTGVVADYEAVWDYDNKVIAWEEADADYGAVASPTSIWLIKWDGNDYITSSQANVAAIAGGLAALEGLYPVADATYLPGGANFDEDKAGTAMLVDDLYEAINLSAWEYKEGFVHFLVWVNNVNDVNNQYEVLRNQFIHMKVTGMGEIAGTFPGYPGDSDDPEIPIDPTDPDNPYPLIPTDPVDPDPTKMKVDVEIRDWTYRENDVTLQR